MEKPTQVGLAGRMETTPGPPPGGSGTALMINSPIAADRLAEMIGRAVSHRPGTVIDHGCGWGEALLQALETSPDATGLGVDVHEGDITRAVGLAKDRGLDGRARFVNGSSADVDDHADLLINLGAYQAFGDPKEALARLRALLNPGGRLLFGFEFWARTPTDEELSHMWEGTTVDECLLLPDMVDLMAAGGWRILDLFESTVQEWDVFERGLQRDRDEWLIAHPDHEEADAVRRELDEDRNRWIRGTRSVMGFAVVLLG